MIRIYLDWNIISNLKRPEFKDIKNFIDEHKNYLQFPYTPAHFSDLMKSYKPGNEYFEKDLETLEYLTENHFIRWEKDDTKFYFFEPKKYFDFIKNQESIPDILNFDKLLNQIDSLGNEIGMGKFGSLIKKSLKAQSIQNKIPKENIELMKEKIPDIKLNSTNMWDFIKDITPFVENLILDRDYFKNFQGKMTGEDFKLDSNAGNWSYNEVISNIDTFLQNSKIEMTFLECVKSSFQHIDKPVSYFAFYKSAYFLLDFIGYKRDKLPKRTDNFLNIDTDTEHSFYGGHCEYFVADDKNLRIKSKVLYKEFSISTKIIKSAELISELTKVIDKSKDEYTFIEDLNAFCNQENFIKSYSYSYNGVMNKRNVFRLPKFYFNFFNYVSYGSIPESNLLLVTFEKFSGNFSDLIYFSESETLIDFLYERFGLKTKKLIAENKKKFVHENKNFKLTWKFKDVLIILNRNEQTGHPKLAYLIDLSKNNERKGN